MISEQVKAQFAAGAQQQLSGMNAVQLAAALDQTIDTYTSEQYALYYDEILHFPNLRMKTICVSLDM